MKKTTTKTDSETYMGPNGLHYYQLAASASRNMHNGHKRLTRRPWFMRRGCGFLAGVVVGTVVLVVVWPFWVRLFDLMGFH